MVTNKNYIPKVSIIIPTRNRKDLLCMAIKSVLNQSYRNLEVVVHDNNSQDGTELLVKEKFNDERLKYYKVNEDLTMQQNWNKAYSYATGDYFLRLDDDNLLEHELVDYYVKGCLLHDLDVILGYPLTFNEQKKAWLYFDTDDFVSRLSKFQWLHFELKPLNDSNYSFYKISTINKIFPDKRIYATSVPDRFMNLSIIDNFDRCAIKVGITTRIAGVTRYDYGRKEIELNRLKFESFESLLEEKNIEEILSTMDCRGMSFTIHLLLCSIYFSGVSKDTTLVKYINRHVNSKSLYRTVIKVNYLNSVSVKEMLSNPIWTMKSFSQVIFSLLLHPRSKLYCTSSYRFLLNISKEFATKLIRKPKVGIPEMKDSLGSCAPTETINRILDGKKLCTERIKSEHGSLVDYIAGIPKI